MIRDSKYIWLKKEYVTRYFKYSLIRKRTLYIRFQKITWLEKEYVF